MQVAMALIHVALRRFAQHSREFVHKSNFDTNGILFYLGTNRPVAGRGRGRAQRGGAWPGSRGDKWGALRGVQGRHIEGYLHHMLTAHTAS